jgi:predicted transcriptional regulator
MATQTSFSHQIQLAEDLKKYLENLHERLFFVTTDYNNKVNDIHQAGMMEEYYSKFVQECVHETNQKIKEVVAQIHERDIPFIERYLAYLNSHSS